MSFDIVIFIYTFTPLNNDSIKKLLSQLIVKLKASWSRGQIYIFSKWFIFFLLYTFINIYEKQQSRYIWKNYPIYQADTLAASHKKADSIAGV